MCKVFSCLVTQAGEGYYDNKIHSHSELQKMFVSQDEMLKDDKLPPTFARVEIIPENRNIVLPDKWVLKVDENEVPAWFKKRHEEKAWSLHEQWLKWLYSEVDASRFPKHPFLQKPDLSKLKEPSEVCNDFVWDAVRDAVWDDVRGAARYAVWDDVWDAVWDDVWDAVWGAARYAVWDAVGAQIGYMFPKCSLWKNGKYKYQDLVDLWQAGIVAFYYENKWHYFVSPNGDGKVKESKE